MLGVAPRSSPFFPLLAGIATLQHPAVSHDWYPMDCCSGTDCAVVEHATYAHELVTDTALPILTARQNTALWRYLPIFRSRDAEMHGCIRPIRDVLKLICLLVPPPS